MAITTFQKVKFTMLEMDIEDDYYCEYDWVAVYNGHSRTDPILGAYCGTTLPAPVTSTGNYIYTSL